jgi:transcriptional regulator with XRE-family HTH domain
MSSRSEILRQVMSETGTTQLRLSRLSGVGQPSISQFSSGRVGFTDAMLSRLVECMGFRLEVTRSPVQPHLSRSAERSWKLHRGLALHLTSLKLEEWAPIISLNITRIQAGIQGEPTSEMFPRFGGH